MFNIEWKRGNPESLEGRVIVYSKLDINDYLKSLKAVKGISEKKRQTAIKSAEKYLETNDEVIYATYWGNDEESFKAKKLTLNDQSQLVFQFMEEVKSFFDHSFGGKYKKTFFEAPLIVKSEEEIMNGDEDVIFVGRYSSNTLCNIAVNAVLDLYNLHFANLKAVSLIETVQPSLDYTSFEKKSIESYITETYVNPIYQAVKDIDSKKIKNLTKKLIDFFETENEASPFKHAPLKANINDLGRTFNKCAKTTDYSLQNLFEEKITVIIQKLDAIHLEKFEKAGELNQRLKELNEELNDYK